MSGEFAERLLAELREERDRAIRERDTALEQRRIALDAAKVARQYRHDEIIGLRNLIERAAPWVAAGGAAEGVDEMIAAQALSLHDDMRAALQGAPSETVAELRRRAEQAESHCDGWRSRAIKAENDVQRRKGRLQNAAACIARLRRRLIARGEQIAELEEKLALVPLTAAIMAVDDVQADYSMLCKVLERVRDHLLTDDEHEHGAPANPKRARLIGDVSEMLAYFTEMSKKDPAS